MKAATKLPVATSERSRSMGRMLPLVILLGVISFFLAATLIWHKLDVSPVEYDQPMYYVQTMQFHEAIQSQDFDWLAQDYMDGMGELAPLQPLRPVLIPLLTALMFLVSGPSKAVAILTVAFFFIVLIFFCYLIAKEWAGPKAGILAAVLLLSFPLLAVLSRQYYFDVPQAAAITAMIYFLIRKDAFANPLTTIAAGLAAGVGMLSRETFPLFAAGPVLASMILYTRRRQLCGARLVTPAIAAGVIVGVLIFLLMVLPFYGTKLDSLLAFAGSRYIVKEPGQGSGLAQTWILNRWVFYTYAYIRGAFTAPMFALALGSIGVLIWRRNRRTARSGYNSDKLLWAVVLSWLLIPYAVSSISSAADLRYVTASIPAFAISLAVLITRVSIGRYQTLAVAVVAVFAVVQFLVISFAPGPVRVDLFTEWTSIASAIKGWSDNTIKANQYMAHVRQMAHPRPQNWRVEDTVSALESLRRQKGIEHATVFVLMPYEAINPGSFITAGVFAGIPASFTGPFGLTREQAVWAMAHSDFIVTRDKTAGDPMIEYCLGRLGSMSYQPTDQVFTLPDGSRVTIYERIQQ